MVLGLSVIWTGDEENRYWQGKAIGGAMTIICIFIGLLFVAAVIAYKETHDYKKIFPIIKDAILAMLSFEPTWKNSKKVTRRK